MTPMRAFVALLVAGCVSPEQIPFHGYEASDVVRFAGLNERIRLDREALTEDQLAAPIGFGGYSDGLSDEGVESEVVSAVRPANLDGDVLTQSECLWVGRKGRLEERVEVNWEVMLEVNELTRSRLEFEPLEIGACRLTDPISGEQVPLFENFLFYHDGETPFFAANKEWTTPVDDGGSGPPVSGGVPAPGFGETVFHIDTSQGGLCADYDCRMADFFLKGTLVTAQEATADSDGHCVSAQSPREDRYTPDFETSEELESAPWSDFPNCHPAGACGKRCEFAPQGDLMLRVDPTEVFGVSPAARADGTYDPAWFDTAMMVVDDRRSIARAMAYDGSAARLTWQTPVHPGPGQGAGVRWEENFSSNVQVVSVRVFQRLESGEEIPLAFEAEAPALMATGPGSSSEIPRSERCTLKASDDGHVAEVSTCFTAAVTPTYFLPSLKQAVAATSPLRWRTDGVASPTGQAMIEFELRALSRTSALLAEPSAMSMDDTAEGAQRQSWIQVSSVGDRTMTVRSVRITGPDAGAFSARIPDGVSVPPGAAGTGFSSAPSPADLVPPFLVPSEDTFSVLVTVSPDRPGDFAATLEIDGEDDLGNQEHIEVPLEVLGLAVHAQAFPPAVTWNEATGSGWSAARTMHLVNTGNVAVDRSAYAIVGADAAHFTVRAPSTSFGTVVPGGSEQVEVEFHPTCAPPFPVKFDGFRHAELVVQTDVGLMRWDLAGSDGLKYICEGL